MPSAVMILVQNGRLLMEQRPDKEDDFFPGAWLFPGGKLDPGEAPWEGLCREATEELGIAIVAADPLCTDEEVFYARPGEQSHRLYPYLVTRWYGEVPGRVLDSDAVLAWRSLNEALASPVDCTRQMAEAVLRVLMSRAACHAPTHRAPGGPPVFAITYRERSTPGRLPVPGATHSAGVCAFCRDRWTAEIERAGGMVVDCQPLPPSPAPVQPEPVGLDAVDPPPPVEPAKVRLPRRRRRKSSGGEG